MGEEGGRGVCEGHRSQQKGTEQPAVLTVAARSGAKEQISLLCSDLFALQKIYQKKLQSVFNVCTNYVAEKAGSFLLEQVMTLPAATV